MSNDDRRLIEDYLPIQAVSAEASREKAVRKGHISTLHLWWAWRPLVACRAAVYGALVPASRFRPLNGPEEKRDSLTRANAAKFVERVCKYPGDPNVIAEAERHILDAHAERLTRETGATVTADGIVAGRAPRPKKPIESRRRAVRYLLAVERVEEKKQQLRLSKDQIDQLREHRRTHESAAESAVRRLYTAVWLPRVENGALGVEKVEVGGRLLQATGIHERVMELLTEGGIKRVHGTLKPRKLVERLKLGESLAPGEPTRLGIRTSDVLEAFFRDIEPPRLESAGAVRKAIADGVTEAIFGYTSGPIPALAPAVSAAIDALVQQRMTADFIPGLSLAIAQNGQTVLADVLSAGLSANTGVPLVHIDVSQSHAASAAFLVQRRRHHLQRRRPWRPDTPTMSRPSPS